MIVLGYHSGEIVHFIHKILFLREAIFSISHRILRGLMPVHYLNTAFLIVFLEHLFICFQPFFRDIHFKRLFFNVISQFLQQI